MTNKELVELVEQLRAENEQLRDDVRAAQSAQTLQISTDEPDAETPAPKAPRRGRGRARTVAAVALVVIGLVLAPVALVGSWAKTQLVDTDTFVATFAPLAADPAVKAFVVTEVMGVIDEQIDFEASTSEVFDAIAALDIPPSAKAALVALKVPAARGLQSLATTVVTGFVDSEAFENIWQQALRLSHQQLVAALTSDPGSAISISGSGELAIQLGPVIEAVKTALVDQGLGFAEAIPTVDAEIVVAQSASFSQLTLLYGLAVSIGQWLPLVALVFLAAGVLVAKRRVVTLFWTSLVFGLVMTVVGIALRVGNVITVSSLAAYVPIDAAGAIYDAVTSLISSTLVAMAVLGFTVALISWVLGPWRPAPALRSVFGDGAARLRAFGDTRGIGTGAFGRFLGRQRLLVQIVIGLGAAAIILFVRPISTGLIVWTAVVAVVLLLLVEVLQRPVATIDLDDPADLDEVSEHPAAPTPEAVAAEPVASTDNMELRG
ncbi:hypothetical protein N1031_07180 [Herbiconiux moechotypicola]|uniref:Integral membrane protein n=1 Tax=Herbiconiux moechotypicola TaxID=637393 RepID=A0ABN3DGH9_9MICO|nr:hypothetical protein [Herbiconiux moechotypicola]MCS5729539.1 hypothetical protein [Herbiconiux moechotypicola]